MKKSIKNKKHSETPKADPQAGPDITVLINRMMQQIVALERKIDGLVSLASPAGRNPDIIQRPPERKQDNGFRERILHKAICAECSKECEVPFRPSGDRPVYCKECFAKRKNGALPHKEKPENRPSDRVVVYERRFQRDQAVEVPKNAAKKRPTARRKR